MTATGSRAGVLGRGFRSLGKRNYRLFWFGQLVSLAGTWMQDVAISWLVLSLTESPVALGLTMTIRFLPALLFSLYGGVLADRLPKRQTIIFAQCVQLLVALTLAILTSTELITVVLIYALAGVRGLVDAIEGPTRQAFVPEMVGTEDVPNAVALNSTLFNAARVAGPAIGAVVIGTLGMAVCFYLNAASFLAVIGALYAMRPEELYSTGGSDHGKSRHRLGEGFRYVRSNPEVILIFIVVGAIGTFGYNFQTLLPLVTKYLLNADASTLGLLMTAMGAGSVVAGLIAAYRGTPSRNLLFGAGGGFVALLFVVGLSGWATATAGLMFLVGLCGVLFMTTANTRLQLLVPAHMRGRVMGMYFVLFVGTTPIGSMITGQLAEHVGVRTTVLGLAALCAIGVAAAFGYSLRSLPERGGGGHPLVLARSTAARQRSVPRADDLPDRPGPM